MDRNVRVGPRGRVKSDQLGLILAGPYESERDLADGSPRAGHQPTCTQSERAATNSGRFNCRTATVVRPHGVRPTISVPSTHQEKCSDHTCRRGFHNRTRLPVEGSRPWTRALLNSL